MKLTRNILGIALSFSVVCAGFLAATVQSVSAQDSNIALQRGYRTGYSDGYMSGYQDSVENAAKSYTRHSDYESADRAFDKTYGSLDTYKDGYKQGFESGYDTGFAKRGFDATLPATLTPRGIDTSIGTNSAAVTTVEAEPIENVSAVKDETNNVGDQVSNATPANTDVTYDKATYSSSDTAALTTQTTPQQSAISGNEIIIIPKDTELVIELLNEINTKTVRAGDEFTARIVSPSEINGAIIEGRIAKNRRPGRLKRRAELILSFDRIKLSNERWSNFNAMIVEVLPLKGDNIKRIDNEGVVKGTRPFKEDGIKVGASTGTGLIIGAIVGGPVGAAVGAGIGAAFGAGIVVVERGNWIRIVSNQQMRIRTVYETQIR